jgi:23S rRNA pseudouridine2605 synthase
LPRVLTVGRLDINTEGLLLLTNDGGLKRVLELPATGWLRKYRVRAFGAIEQDRLDKLKAGTELDGVKYGPIEAVLERVQGGNVWLTVSLREGKNREVKNVLAALGLQVNRLIRVSFGPFQLGDLPIGAVSPVRTRILRDQLGEKLAKKAGVDFDSALPEEPAQDEAKKAPKSPRDPNARLRPRAERAGKPVPAPKPRTGEPRFAKKRAEGKVPPYAATGFDEEKPAKRRVLFDDGRELVEDAPRPRRDRGDKRGFDTGKPVSRSARPQAKSYGDRPAGRTGGKPHSRTGGKPGASRPSGQGPSRPRRPARPGSGKPRN